MADTILFVDDESNILRSLQRLVLDEEWEVLTADSARAGLAVLSQTPAQVVVSDQRMPEMDGTDFLKEVRRLYPDTVRVILSGYVDVGTISEMVNQGEVYRCFTKPWNDDELVMNLRQCFEHYHLQSANRQLSEQISRQNEELKRMNEKLAEEVDNRTLFLRLTQQILAHIPVAIVGVDGEGKLVFQNDAANALCPKLCGCFPGTDIGQVLPDEAMCEISSFLQKPVPKHRFQFCWSGTEFEMDMIDLSNRGAILMLRPGRNEVGNG